MRNSVSFALAAILASCSSAPEGSAPTNTPETSFAQFSATRPAYRILPGDQLEITIFAAPELSRTAIVGPDGRITMPISGPVFIADQTVEEAQATVMRHMSNALVDPRLDLLVTGFSPQQVFVGGAVGTPGAIELPGQIDPLQAIILAGGFTAESNMRQVLVIRRGPDGTVQSFDFNVRDGIYNPKLAKFGPLKRFDVLYVPQSRIAQQNQFIQQYIRNALPIDFSLFYDLRGNNNN